MAVIIGFEGPGGGGGGGDCGGGGGASNRPSHLISKNYVDYQ